VPVRPVQPPNNDTVWLIRHTADRWMSRHIAGTCVVGVDISVHAPEGARCCGFPAATSAYRFQDRTTRRVDSHYAGPLLDTADRVGGGQGVANVIVEILPLIAGVGGVHLAHRGFSAPCLGADAMDKAALACTTSCVEVRAPTSTDFFGCQTAWSSGQYIAVHRSRRW
jgi:hypothetical protein